jgi:hypothetical protein
MYLSMVASMASHYLAVITITKLKEISFMLPPAFLVLISIIIVSKSVILDLVFTNINGLCVSIIKLSYGCFC